MNSQFARAWMVLASGALLLSGLLALVITGAKMPGIKNLVSDLDLIRWSLVVHVNLATLVWFTALPVALFHYAIGGDAKARAGVLSHIGFFLSVLGVFLMLSVPPNTDAEIVLANYVPVLAHPRYYLALSLYLAGIVLNCLSPTLLRPAPEMKEPGWNEVRFGLAIGAVFIIMAAMTFLTAYLQLGSVPLISAKTYFEIGMWGGGHLLQHASTTFLLCCWILLLSKEAGQPLLSRRTLFPVFALLATPVFVIPLLWLQPVASSNYHSGFTSLMRWGIAPAAVLMLVLLLKRFPLLRQHFKSYRTMAFVFSALLLLLGFLFGALIRGSDMRVPGHYHAGIGAVTLTFMAMAFHMLAPNMLNRWILRTVWTYGIGQIFFSAGMFVAGSYGMGRKTYGAEHALTHWGQSVGFTMMAVGGLAAFAGGLFFAMAIVPFLQLTLSFKHKSSDTVKPDHRGKKPQQRRGRQEIKAAQEGGRQ